MNVDVCFTDWLVCNCCYLLWMFMCVSLTDLSVTDATYYECWCMRYNFDAQQLPVMRNYSKLYRGISVVKNNKFIQGKSFKSSCRCCCHYECMNVLFPFSIYCQNIAGFRVEYYKPFQWTMLPVAYRMLAPWDVTVAGSYIPIVLITLLA